MIIKTSSFINMNFLLKILLLSLSIFNLSVCLIYAQTKKSENRHDYFYENNNLNKYHELNLKPIIKRSNSINIVIDPKIELLSIIQNIGAYRENLLFLLNKEEFPYKKEALESFSKFKSHKAVTMMDDLSTRMFRFSAPPSFVLYLDDDFNIRENIKLDDFLMERIEGKENLIKLTDYIKDFCEESEFGKFFTGNINFYNHLINNVITKIGNRNYIDELETFYGTKQTSYNIVLVPLYGSVGFGPMLETNNGDRHIFSIIGPNGLENGIPFFGDSEYFKYMILHEFSHSFINPLTEKEWVKAEKYSYLMERVPEKVKNNITSDWKEYFDELVIRCIVIKLVTDKNKESGDNILNKEKNRGFIYIEDILDKIEYYEKNRDKYPTFESYYCKLLEAFDKYQK